jgi:hypothetical protein
MLYEWPGSRETSGPFSFVRCVVLQDQTGGTTIFTSVAPDAIPSATVKMTE